MDWLWNMRRLVALMVTGFLALAVQAESFQLRSPDGGLTLAFKLSDGLPQWGLSRAGKALVADSRLGLVFGRQEPLSAFKVIDHSTRSSDTSWTTRFYRRGKVRDRYNELSVTLEEVRAVQHVTGMDAGDLGPAARRIGLVFRAYEEGVAFRYVIPEQKAFDGFQLLREETEWRLPGAPVGWVTTYEDHFTAQEEPFEKVRLRDVDQKRLIGMPVVVEAEGATLALCEACLVDWAGMFYRQSSGADEPETTLQAVLTPLPKTEAALGDVAVICSTPAKSPWRVVMVGDSPLDLLGKNDILVNLNPPPEPGLDFSWVKPGPSSWDWWVDSNNSLSTTLTLKMIDLAADMGWPYHTIDGGWYGFGRSPNHGPNVRLEPRKDFDLAKVVAYGRERNVGIWVWIHWMEIDDTGVEETFARLEKWGIRGVKTDFLNRQDQWMVKWYERVCQAAARHRIMVNFHGAHKPTGTERTWPNNLTREGILGNEVNKFRPVSSEHCATLPFTRFLIGPGDFTPGSFGNVHARDFVPQCRRGHRYGDERQRGRIWAEEPGTRAQAIAKCIAFDSPLTTLCDWPERYRNAKGSDALVNLPTVWKATRPVAGEPGSHYAVLRETFDGRFYFAAFSVEKRQLALKLDFLDSGSWTMRTLADDPIKTPDDACALTVLSKDVRGGQTEEFYLLPGGGAVAIFEKRGDK